MARHPLRRGVFVLTTPDTPILGAWLRTRRPFQAQLWEIVLGPRTDELVGDCLTEPLDPYDHPA